MVHVRAKASLLRDRRWLVGVCAAALLMVAGAFMLTRCASGGGAVMQSKARKDAQAYGWDELSAIAGEVARCSSTSAAARCACRYGLCDASGTPSDVSWELALADGSCAHARLAGVWCDERSDGGRAGLTFVLTEAVGPHAMNHRFEDAEGEHADSTGGWEACDMRAWLENDLWYELPSDLRAVIVPVQKRTANRVGTNDELERPGTLAGSAADWVSETSDRLWLLSASELCGEVPAREDLGVDVSMTPIYAAEGAQYPLFAQAGCAAFEPQESLVRTQAQDEDARPVTWWLRSKTLEFDEGFWLVGTDGTPLNGFGEDARVVEDASYAPRELWGPDHSRGVVVGFCL